MKSHLRSQRGFTLVEAAVSVALVAIAAGGALWALAAFGKYGTHQAGPHRTAALAFARSLVGVAQDAWKYGQPGISPSGSWQTALPLAVPDAPPTTMPVAITAAYRQLQTPDPAGIDPTLPSAEVTITLTYPPDPDHADSGSVSQRATLHVRAPAPGTRIAPAGLVPEPAGAP
ncbi:MAG TPA: prepilin-type N-terminal cleavage/methylation domain-containing protein [Candidatus Baltobacteraceae bacterium]